MVNEMRQAIDKTMIKARWSQVDSPYECSHPTRSEMANPKSIEELCKERGISADELAARSGLDPQRVLAIVLGRWTPSPRERDCVAAVFELTKDQIAWGHKTPIQHIYGQGPT
jgi:cyanate lyase